MLLLLDVDVSSPDEKSVITYVSSLYDAFPKVPEGGEGIGANVSIDFSILKLITQLTEFSESAFCSHIFCSYDLKEMEV